jgi:ubiquinone/menaquinone biosynthesis C-methylase UbiE
MKEEEMRRKVREGYARIAIRQVSCCGSTTSNEAGRKMGYTDEELQSVPENANMGLGCGNPVALASLKEGETVVDLGSGGGFDCFLAAKRVGERGRVIGVDMTPEMIDKARHNARKGKYRNVEFRLGEIENLPVANNTADVVISNCVINLAPNKKRVFEEAFRVLKSGGRLMISDEVLVKELPEATRKRTAPAGCVQGAIMKDEYIKTIKQVGFQSVEIVGSTQSAFEDIADDPDAKIMVFNPEKGVEELRGVSELDEEQKVVLREIMTAVESVRIAAIKP